MVRSGRSNGLCNHNYRSNKCSCSYGSFRDLTFNVAGLT